MSTIGATSPVRPARPFNILIVDDNKDLVEFVNCLLSHNGFQVRCAYSGAQGLQIVSDQEVDLVILDVMMPQMDGLTVLRELKRIAPALPVFLLTAKDDLATRTAAMKLGASDFLAKPINMNDFLTRIRTQCETSRWDKRLDSTFGNPV